MNVFSKPLLCADISGETEEVLLKRAAEHMLSMIIYKEEIMTSEMQQNIKLHIKSLNCVALREIQLVLQHQSSSNRGINLGRR